MSSNRLSFIPVQPQMSRDNFAALQMADDTMRQENTSAKIFTKQTSIPYQLPIRKWRIIYKLKEYSNILMRFFYILPDSLHLNVCMNCTFCLVAERGK
jgi:hypothetical protein